jgi:hypothetical protein
VAEHDHHRQADGPPRDLRSLTMAGPPSVPTSRSARARPPAQDRRVVHGRARPRETRASATARSSGGDGSRARTMRQIFGPPSRRSRRSPKARSPQRRVVCRSVAIGYPVGHGGHSPT